MRTADYAEPMVWDGIGAFLRRHPVTVGGAGGLVGWVHCEPGWSWERQLDEYDIWSVAGGRGEASVNGRRYRLHRGVTLMLRPGDRVAAVQHPVDRLTVGFAHYLHSAAGKHSAAGEPSAAGKPGAAGKPSAAGDSVLPPQLVELRDPHLVHDPLRALVRRLERPDPAAALQAAALLQAVLLEVHAQAAQQAGCLPLPIDPRIRAAVERLRSQPSSRPSVQDLAESVHLSAAHFSRLFRQETGTSFRAYCVQARMDRARGLLVDTSLSVTQVAQLLGYPDYRLFARQFADRHGRSPSVWRSTAA